MIVWKIGDEIINLYSSIHIIHLCSIVTKVTKNVG